MEHTKKNIEAIKEFCMRHPNVYEARPFGKYPICYKVMGKIYVQFFPEEHFYKITLKCKPENANVYRELYPGIVVRGYHCPPVQQPYWNTIELEAFTDMELLFQMIEEAYEAVIESFSKRVKLQLEALSSIKFKYTKGNDPDFVFLCGKLDHDLNEMVGGNSNRKEYEKYNNRDSIHHVIVAYSNNEPIACGSFKMFDEEHAELKRIYTDSRFRNMGLGTEIIRRLEASAKMKGYRWCILETGKDFEPARHMYEKLGYKVIPNYGQYANKPLSVCMEKKI